MASDKPPFPWKRVDLGLTEPSRIEHHIDPFTMEYPPSDEYVYGTDGKPGVMRPMDFDAELLSGQITYTQEHIDHWKSIPKAPVEDFYYNLWVVYFFITEAYDRTLPGRWFKCGPPREWQPAPSHMAHSRLFARKVIERLAPFAYGADKKEWYDGKRRAGMNEHDTNLAIVQRLVEDRETWARYSDVVDNDMRLLTDG